MGHVQIGWRGSLLGAVLLSAALACAGCSSGPCTIDGTVAGGSSDCGELDLTGQDSASEASAAQSCVLQAVSNGASFKLVWTSSDERGPTTEAYGSAGEGTPLYHYLSQADYSAPTSPNVRRWTCGNIASTTGCTVSGGDFCLTCTSEVEEVQLCGS